ncbi:MAG: molybdopterin-guanine dinucleotide biosynthesis protein B [Candidatus Methanomethyliaceae archaeon]|nr:molybdopterin-guanine dinucleotide biosynthesis protein B [Candidatus Methanomethyliaceae archaeon]MDW7971215.1 molybdopterin-guanine dinucleotide biosynthesis protein B [Nitrososphaerota archaeon]
MKIICIISPGSGYGKTTLIEKIIREMVKRGLRVCAIKHSSHHIEEDYGKDSWRFRRAGAMASALISNNGIIYVSNPNFVFSIISSINPDFIICEGFKESNYPKLVIIKDVNEFQMLKEISNIIGVVYDGVVYDGKITNMKIPILKNVEEIVEFLISVVKEIV